MEENPNGLSGDSATFINHYWDNDGGQPLSQNLVTQPRILNVKNELFKKIKVCILRISKALRINNLDASLWEFFGLQSHANRFDTNLGYKWVFLPRELVAYRWFAVAYVAQQQNTGKLCWIIDLKILNLFGEMMREFQSHEENFKKFFLHLCLFVEFFLFLKFLLILLVLFWAMDEFSQIRLILLRI